MSEPQSTVYCPLHSYRANKAQHEEIDRVMSSLPDSQAGAGRHKCPYCAYQRGYEQAIRDVAFWANERLRQPAS